MSTEHQQENVLGDVEDQVLDLLNSLGFSDAEPQDVPKSENSATFAVRAIASDRPPVLYDVFGQVRRADLPVVDLQELKKLQTILQDLGISDAAIHATLRRFVKGIVVRTSPEGYEDFFYWSETIGGRGFVHRAPASSDKQTTSPKTFIQEPTDQRLPEDQSPALRDEAEPTVRWRTLGPASIGAAVLIGMAAGLVGGPLSAPIGAIVGLLIGDRLDRATSEPTS